MDKKHLTEQVERIIDEGKGFRREVVIQLAYTDEMEASIKPMVNAAAKLVERRNLARSSREILPKPYRKPIRQAKSGGADSASRKGLSSPQSVRNSGQRLLESFVKFDDIAASIERAKTPTQKKKNLDVRESIQMFPFSASTVMTVTVDDLWKLLDRFEEISDIYPNRIVPAPRICEVDMDRLPQNILDNKTSAWGVNAIGAMSVWGGWQTRGRGLKVAVLDTGVDASHPDLQTADGKSSRVTQFQEFDESGRLVVSKAHDSAKHGTHCCGTIGGRNRSGQWIGVAPDVELHVGLVLKGGSGTDAQILKGMEWAISSGADVISMSLGGLRLGPDVPDTYTRTIIKANQLGIPVVVSIGNEGCQTSGSPGSDFFAFSVGATDHLDRSAGFSGGRTQVVAKSRFIDPRNLPLVFQKPEISAPGVAIKSCVPKNKYDTWNGTSMAAPHVAGAIALLLAATDIRGKVPQDERAFFIQDMLMGAVEEVGESGQDQRFGTGRLDVLRAVGLATELGYGKELKPNQVELDWDIDGR